MSKSPIIMPSGLPPITLTENQQDCVEVLREALSQAELGNVNTVGIVLCMRKGFASNFGGTDASSLNLGLDSLKRKILENVEGAQRRKVM